MRIFRKIHLWLSVPFGVIITLICFSGAMLVFEPEITRGLKGDIYYVTSAEGEPIDMKELMETVKATLPDSVSITVSPSLMIKTEHIRSACRNLVGHHFSSTSIPAKSLVNMNGLDSSLQCSGFTDGFWTVVILTEGG